MRVLDVKCSLTRGLSQQMMQSYTSSVPQASADLPADAGGGAAAAGALPGAKIGGAAGRGSLATHTAAVDVLAAVVALAEAAAAKAAAASVPSAGSQTLRPRCALRCPSALPHGGSAAAVPGWLLLWLFTCKTGTASCDEPALSIDAAVRHPEQGVLKSCAPSTPATDMQSCRQSGSTAPSHSTFVLQHPARRFHWLPHLCKGQAVQLCRRFFDSALLPSYSRRGLWLPAPPVKLLPRWCLGAAVVQRQPQEVAGGRALSRRMRLGGRPGAVRLRLSRCVDCGWRWLHARSCGSRC